MKVLFSNPPWWVRPDRSLIGIVGRRWIAGVRAGSRWPFTQRVRSRPGRFVYRDYAPYPYFMGYAATYTAKMTGADVHFRDSIALRETYEQFWAHLSREPYDYIFIESSTPSWDHDEKLIREIHDKHPRTRIVVTGPITSTRGNEILESNPVHACAKGEYEKASVAIVNGASGLIENDLLTLAEMNAAPFPYFDDVYAHRYWDDNPLGQRWPHAQIWSSRGCPFKCIFCVWPATMTGNDPDGTKARTVRHYSADYMHAFVTEIIGRYSFKSIYFDDDTFNLGNTHVVAMCDVMRRIGIPWSAMCRADTNKMELWKLMRESGCFGVKLGFESGNQYVVDKIVNKHLDLEYAKQVVYECKRLGMTVHGTFTYGLPGETPEQMRDTKAFIKSLPFDSFQESGTAELEGTPMHTLAVEGALKQKGFAGARMDENYSRELDGNQKMLHLVKSLQS